MTTTPSIGTVSIITRMASTAAWSAASLSPRPIQRAPARAAASVTRTSSMARFLSGASPVGPDARILPPGLGSSSTVRALYPLHRRFVIGVERNGKTPRHMPRLRRVTAPVRDALRGEQPAHWEGAQVAELLRRQVAVDPGAGCVPLPGNRSSSSLAVPAALVDLQDVQTAVRIERVDDGSRLVPRRPVGGPRRTVGREVVADLADPPWVGRVEEACPLLVPPHGSDTGLLAEPVRRAVH